MKIRIKLTLGFSVVVLLIWATVFFAVNTYTAIQERFEFLEKTVIPSLFQISEMKNAADEAKHEIMEYVLYDEEVERQRALSTVEYFEEMRLEHIGYMKRMEQMGEEAQIASGHLAMEIDAFNSAVVEMAALKSQGVSADELLKRTRETINPVFMTLVASLEEHRVSHVEWLVESEEAAREANTSGVQVLLLAAGLVTLLAVAVAFFISRSIVNPLHALHRGTEIIGQGNLDYKVGTRTKDEVGHLSRAFDQMTENLKGNITSIDNLNKEITERKRAEKELISSEERLRILFEFAPDAYYLGNLKGHFVDGNRAAEETTGYKREELIGNSFLKLQLLSPRQIPRAAALLAKNVLGQPTGPDEFTLRRKDGSQVSVEIRTFPVKIKGQTLVLGIAHDITERKRTELELQEKNEQLDVQNEELQSQSEELITQQQELIEKNRQVEEANRLKSEFFAQMSHELRTPLHSINGFTQLMLGDKVPDPDTRKEFLTIIDKQSVHLGSLIDNLLDMSRLESGRFRIQKQHISIKDVLYYSILSSYSLTNEKGIVINEDVPAVLPEVEADEGRLKQVVVNLLSNAIKFSNKRSNITVKAEVNGKELLMQVIDHGIGIPEESMAHLFERYYQVEYSPVGGGTGLGLYISKQIIEAHDGRIWAESKLGEGSTFSFTLPLDKAGGDFDK